MTSLHLWQARRKKKILPYYKVASYGFFGKQEAVKA